MPGLGGILETVLFVADVARARAFYQAVLGLEPFMQGDDGCGFEAAEGQLLLLVSEDKATRPTPTPGGTVPACLAEPGAARGAGHVAFAVAADDLDAWRERLVAQGVAVAGDVAWERGGRSLYFRDPDGHLLELAAPGIWEVY